LRIIRVGGGRIKDANRVAQGFPATMPGFIRHIKRPIDCMMEQTERKFFLLAVSGSLPVT